MAADEELLGPALLQLDALAWACSFRSAQIGFGRLGWSASIGECKGMFFFPFEGSR